MDGGTCAGGEWVGVDMGGGDREGVGEGVEGEGVLTGRRSGPSSDMNICMRRSVYVSELSVPETREPLELSTAEREKGRILTKQVRIVVGPTYQG